MGLYVSKNNGAARKRKGQTTILNGLTRVSDVGSKSHLVASSVQRVVGAEGMLPAWDIFTYYQQ